MILPIYKSKKSLDTSISVSSTLKRVQERLSKVAQSSKEMISKRMDNFFDRAPVRQAASKISPINLSDKRRPMSSLRSVQKSAKRLSGSFGNHSASAPQQTTSGVNENEFLLSQDTIGHRSYQSATTATLFSNVAFHGVPLIDGNIGIQ
ncbi:unnamed protein product [Ambrosiozyma monospora]|uniref:Unnamed protein product n=1 Tax=Ambrosiozyma monospora TaxID=43982 RepID=A0ACB5SRU5_AMBMO|nr:unnamed protein product [Ambrosiozyma monospora]